MDPFHVHNLPGIMGLPILSSIGGRIVAAVMEHPEVKKLMESGQKFDVCFLEVFHANALAVKKFKSNLK